MGNKNSSSIPNENTKLLPDEDQHGAGQELLPYEDQHGAGRELLPYEDQHGAGRELHPNGAEQELHPNGAEQELHPNGAEQELHPDGAEQELHPDGAEQELHPNGAEQESHPGEDQHGAGQEEHCMVCRKSTQINDFSELKPGDHIEMPMFSKNRSPFHHHAIVRKIIPKSIQESATPLEGNGSQNVGHIAQVKVIDVPSAGDTLCQQYIPFKSGNYQIKSHTLCIEDEYTDDDEEEGQDEVRDQVKNKVEDKEIDCKKFAIRRVDYRRRQNTHEQTLKNARQMKKNPPKDLKYNLCVRNCEHFCVAMVNQVAQNDAATDAQNGMHQSIETATCLQSARCFWVSFHIILFIFQFLLYTFNFKLYAVYAQGNERYNNFLGNSSNNVLRYCYTGSYVRGFNTTCDWYTLLVLLVIYILAYGYLLFIQHRKRLKDVCNQCLISARIVFITKVIFFTGLEISNIFFEKYIYLLIEAIAKPGILTWFFIFIFSSIELCIVLILVPHIVVKLLIYRFLKCCQISSSKCSGCCSAVCCYPWDFDNDSHEYVIHYA